MSVAPVMREGYLLHHIIDLHPTAHQQSLVPSWRVREQPERKIY